MLRPMHGPMLIVAPIRSMSQYFQKHDGREKGRVDTPRQKSLRGFSKHGLGMGHSGTYI